MADKCSEININIPKIGHCYKLCPFSEPYYDGWGINKVDCGPADTSLKGNSWNFPQGGRDGSSPFGVTGCPTFSSHVNTSGNMVTHIRGGNAIGWMCPDNDCIYFTTTGVRYYEQ